MRPGDLRGSDEFVPAPPGSPGSRGNNRSGCVAAGREVQGATERAGRKARGIPDPGREGPRTEYGDSGISENGRSGKDRRQPPGTRDASDRPDRRPAEIEGIRTGFTDAHLGEKCGVARPDAPSRPTKTQQIQVG